MKYFIYHFTYHTSVQTEHSVKSRIELPPNVSMENVHDIFEELIDNIITTRKTHQNTTRKQQTANEGTTETMVISKAANLQGYV